ncbi:MAG TPA: hypothetical protein VFH27_05195 [Longimicrobiaceae bacterium]|nr:hypothetical protein [Longimicrobiaceae bacterium]
MLALAAAPASAQASGGGPPASLVGAWRGTSICTPVGKPACHDETVVYYMRPAPGQAAHAAPGGERLTWVANKIVNGKEEEMGELACAYVRRTGVVTCPMRGWMWRLRAQGTSMTGTLVSPQGVVWRHVRVARSGT